MDRRSILSITRWVALGFSVPLLLGGTSALGAKQRENAAAHPKPCTVSNVASVYGLTGSGTIVSNPFGLPEGPVVTVGVITFDTQGEWVSQRTANVNGQVIPDLSQAGTYTVYPDCTFTFVDATNNAVQFVGVFIADREEGWFMATGEGVVVLYTLKRLRGWGRR